MLLATFLGMGLGAALGRDRPHLARWGLPALAAIALILGAASPLGLTYLTFPDPALFIWGAGMGWERNGNAVFQFIRSALVVTACFWAVAGVFMLIGTLVGHYFARMPPLRAYAVDLGGSLAGVLAMALLAALWAPPPVWIALGVIPLAWIVRDRWSILAGIVAIAAAAWSMQGATFSPYNRIDMKPDVSYTGLGANPSGATEWDLSANRDYHQRLLDLRASNQSDAGRRKVATIYELPFSFTRAKQPSALVVGAGTGNDVAAALRRGFARVVSIDIDPAILKAGVERHPEHPYSDPRVVRVNDDARAYFGRRSNDEKFDVVCYGLLDSHAMFSSMSSLRLDNFVYTEQGLAEAWSRVKDDGILSVSFSVVAGPWMRDRMLSMIAKATHQQPIVIDHHYDNGATFLVGRDLFLETVRKVAPVAVQGDVAAASWINTPTDDWPFLYLRPGAIAWTYVTVFALLALTTTFAIRRVYGKGLVSRFDAQMFLLGAAFMLLETRAVTQLSLLFGSTWIVNTSVFGGVLAMVLAANAVARRLPRYSSMLWYGLLGAALLAVWVFPWESLFDLGIVGRGVVAGLAIGLPIFFAGVIFSSELARRADAAAALGSNLCGAMVGGLFENLSMVIGLKAILLLAFVAYLASMLTALRRAGHAAYSPGD